jgi:hypothetical protein
MPVQYVLFVSIDHDCAPPLALLFDLDDTLWPIGPVIAAAEESWHAWLAANAPKVAQAFSVAELRVRRMALLERRPELVADLYQLRREALAEVFAELGEDPAHIDGAMQHFAVQRNRWCRLPTCCRCCRCCRACCAWAWSPMAMPILK